MIEQPNALLKDNNEQITGSKEREGHYAVKTKYYART